jgi:hypothetical protein
MLRRFIALLRTWIPEGIKARIRPILARRKRRDAMRVTRSLPVNAAARRRYQARARHIVFVSEVPRVREAKFAHALRTQGWAVALLFGATPNYPLNAHFDEWMQFRNPDEALGLALGYTPVAYHGFRLPGTLRARIS